MSSRFECNVLSGGVSISIPRKKRPRCQKTRPSDARTEHPLPSHPGVMSGSSEKHEFRRRPRHIKRPKRSTTPKSLPPPPVTSPPPIPPPPGLPTLASGEDYIAFEDSPPESGPDHVDLSGGKSERSEKRKFITFDKDVGQANPKRQRVAPASKKSPWASDVDWSSCTHVAQMLHREVEAFVKYVSPTPVEDEVRGMVIQIISRAIVQDYPGAKVHAFGSYETKLYLPSGDLDLVIESDAMARHDRVHVLRSLALLMRRTGITEKVDIIAKAKVPIIKFITSCGRLSVDISINQLNGVAAGKKVVEYLNHYPALRALVLVIKCFVAQRSLNEVYTGGIGSYGVVCMALSFLQMHPKIRRAEIDPSENFGVLLIEFFELYGHYFNYEVVGISIRGSGSYFSKRERGFFDPNRASNLSIEDPGDSTNDITRGSFNFRSVRMAFAGAYETMMAKSYQQARFLSSIRNNRYVDLHGTTSGLKPEEMSILGTVIGVTQEFVNRRRLLVEVFEAGDLHRLLGVPKMPYQPISLIGAAPTYKRTMVLHSTPAQAVSQTSEDKTDRRSLSGSDVEGSGRYNLTAPPRKRMRHSLDDGAQTIFVADDSPAREQESDDDLQEYDVDAPASVLSMRVDRSSVERRRDYWLSKASLSNDSRDRPYDSSD